MASSSELILGIDLGTTNSLVAVKTPDGVQILKDGDSSLIPSAIVFDTDGRVLAVGPRAKTLKSVDPRHIAYSFKRLIGKGKADLEKLSAGLPFDFSPSDPEMIRIKMGKRAYTPIELSAEVLKRCRSVAENTIGRKITKAVVTVPAYFNDAERSATQLAARLAGLQVLRILNEPTAAALAYGLGEVKGQKLIAVYDFGGGTFDVSVLKVTDGIFEVLSTSGDTRLGGDDLDQTFYRFILKKLKNPPKTEEDEVMLLTQCEAIKRALSDSKEIEARFQFGGQIQWTGTILRTDLESLFQPIIEKTLRCCREALEAIDLKPAKIEEVVMVGGSTRVPLVLKRVEEFFGRKPNTSVNPDEVVARGAAIQAAVLQGTVDETLLLDVVPLSLGIETMGGLVSKIIPRNAKIPCSVSEMYTTYADNQTAVDLHILQGEREKVSDCRSLGKFKLRIPPGPAGMTKIKVNFTMTADGILKVTARDEKTNALSSLDVRPSFGLKDEEVERMLREAMESAQEDAEVRALIETQNQARTLIRAVEKSLENPVLSDEFKHSQKEILRPVLKALKTDIEVAKREVILSRISELDHLSRNLAAQILDQSIKVALTGKNLDAAI